MIDKFQCQTHTRTPWGSNPHRYDYRLRYLMMGLLCVCVFAIFIVSLVITGDSALKNYQIDPSDDQSPTTTAGPPFSTPYNATVTNSVANITTYYKSGRIT
ncbi:uncharacterized protein TrAtP1_005657 [Trichoderma atroviride]|uniref:uncharacterized protein n=1 Tax=Hypocrea atroviridis TaxID=63577 RepID=UPI00332FDA3F|nr:hypothetical protein TrAtP1_005657 [Trichoderma atroviride]